MDFDDSLAEGAFRADARTWLSANTEPLAVGEAAHGILQEGVDAETVAAAQAWQARKDAAGWARLTWPRDFGGRQAGVVEQVIWSAEEARRRVPPNIFRIGVEMAAPTLMQFGTAEQMRRWLEPTASGQDIWCQLFSEPGAGSDLAAVQTRARPTATGWIVDGQKVWTTGAHFSRWGLLLARTDPEAPKHAGLTFFVVDMRAPGIEVRPIRQISGGSGFNEVFLSSVEVSDDCRIGEVGQGWRVALATLAHERSMISGGLPPTLIHDLVQEAHRSDQGEAWRTGVGLEVGRLWASVKALELTGLRYLSQAGRSGSLGPEAALFKLVAPRIWQEAASLALELDGVESLAADRIDKGGWIDGFLTAPGLRIAGGADEIMRNIIAERILGLPQEPRADKAAPAAQPKERPPQ